MTLSSQSEIFAGLWLHVAETGEPVRIPAPSAQRAKSLRNALYKVAANGKASLGLQRAKEACQIRVEVSDSGQQIIVIETKLAANGLVDLLDNLNLPPDIADRGRDALSGGQVIPNDPDKVRHETPFDATAFEAELRKLHPIDPTLDKYGLLGDK